MLLSHHGTDQVCKDAGRAYYVKASKDDNITMGYSSWDKPFLLDLRGMVAEVRKEKRYKERVQRETTEETAAIIKETSAKPTGQNREI